MSRPNGLPLLSGPPPDPVGPESACRKCNKKFVFLLARSRRCNHCGYLYCSACTGHAAIMPKDNSYEAVPVCAICIGNLTITAGSDQYLCSLPISKLKAYAKAYNLPFPGGIEKKDLVEKLISCRNNGCLPAENENYYRNRLREGFVPPNSRHGSVRPSPSRVPRPQAPRPQPNLSTRPLSTSHDTVPPPTLDQLLNMSPEEIRILPTRVLQEILFRNRVRMNHVVEKFELVERVTKLIADEREGREREGREEEDPLRHMGREAETHREPQDEFLNLGHQTPDASPGQTSERIPNADANDVTPPKQQSTTVTVCVICQDKEANIAIVDCGHLALCQECSGLIMKSTRECPMCRQRIVTEARLLRIFRA